MKMNEWPAVEIDGFTGVNVVAVPVFAPVADLVAAAADRMGFDRSALLHVVMGVGLALIEQHGPPTPVPTFAPSVPPAETNEEA